MTVYVGGLRDRLIHDSLYHMVQGGLTALGWLNPGASFVNPINFIPEQVDWDKEIPLNSITIAPGNVTDKEWELGTYGQQNCWEFYIDIYGEKEALGLQLSGDIRDVLRGKFPDLGYGLPELNVYDYTQATPPWLFYCDIENVTRDRVQTFTHFWQRYLYTVRLEVVDYYTNRDDAFYINSGDAPPGTGPG